MNKALLTIVIVVAIIILGLGAWWLYAGMQARNTIQYSNQTTNPAQNQNAAQGKVYVGLTDATANMGSVSAINMTVDKVYLHSQAQGWVTVSGDPHVYNLLDLKTKKATALLATATVKVDTYDQIWLHVSDVSVVASGKTTSATLPSGDMKINTIIKVTENTDAAAKLDVLADQSLYTTAKGEYIFAPVVTLESRSNATVNVDSSNMMVIVNGNVDSTMNVGMDENGEVKTDFKLQRNAALEITAGIIIIK